jgi:hypothetical protein
MRHKRTGNIGDPYATKYKGIWVALTTLTRALAGNYVNFGVFELYGDRALADALDIAIKMSLYIPLTDIMAFRKARPLASPQSQLCPCLRAPNTTRRHRALVVACSISPFSCCCAGDCGSCKLKSTGSSVGHDS